MAVQRLGLKPQEAADSIGISRVMLYECIKSGDLRTSKVGRRRIITPEALKQFLEKKSVEALTR